MRILLLFALLIIPATLIAADQITPGATSILEEHVMGDPAAKVTLIEYASLTCSHCSHFVTEVLPKLTDKYIATGKVKLIYRDFPLDAMSLRAAQIANCLPPERFFGFIKTLYVNQEGWLSSSNPDATLEQYAKLAGLPADRIASCLADKKLQDALVQSRMEAGRKYNITGTPSFVVNEGKGMITGVATFDSFETELKKYVK